MLPHLDSWLIFFSKILTSLQQSKGEKDTLVIGAALREVVQWVHLSWLELRCSELLGPGGGDYGGQALVSGKHPQGASLETKRVPVAGSRVGQLEA